MCVVAVKVTPLREYFSCVKRNTYVAKAAFETIAHQHSVSKYIVKELQ
jgi:hypothetical protein